MAFQDRDKTGETKKWPTPHLALTYRTWSRLQELINAGNVEINGYNLDIATVVAVSRFGCKPVIEKSPELLERLKESQDVLLEHMRNGRQIYGVNTGFGGNADLRTDNLINLQRALTQHQQSAIMTRDDFDAHPDGDRELNPHSMPTSWVKGSMLVRCNTNVRGHSAVSWKIVDTLAELIRRDMTPIVPLRGSISASGDLMPLSYIAGVLQGNTDIFVRYGRGKDVRVMNSLQALEVIRDINIQEKGTDAEDQYSVITLGPKEGLALVNGTAPSATVAALALHETNQLAVLSQLVTCLSSETLAANVEWTHPFIAEVRPHPGQMEASQNLRVFLDGSKLVTGLGERNNCSDEGLVQDRYAVRSSPQWVGPQLEDLCFAAEQLVRELNSTTDNPLVNSESRSVHCGANFQAASVTMVAEKTRLCLQMIGKMLFAQTSEMINPTLNNGLPPNLAPDDPSLSYCMKGVDINMAAYQSELAFLANAVSSHVQSAEMHNQSINSLALVSARYTMQSVELVAMMTASAIYVGLQGVDLRVMHNTFLERFREKAMDIIHRSFLADFEEEYAFSMHQELWDKFCETWTANADKDAKDRSEKVADTMVDLVLRLYCSTQQSQNAPADSASAYLDILNCRDDLRINTLTAFRAHQSHFFENPWTRPHLGCGTQVLYQFVREELGVPFYRGLLENMELVENREFEFEPLGRPKKTIGFWISTIYEAVRDGRLAGKMLKSFECLAGA
ncbi:phenylalanine ammonia-lyase [Exophiala viscosa]|uniref:Phenylalanine ammonia-lyase n=1 Tax=Exophiala viscosa TaxID=2486360 RepID=A0AAN6IFU6_9EURO|nr:phenylalanine ammonia-lyase [Exophiala viscosa]KAI1629952.1 phenylalanine ammonia-lyase [Exophiala viscosa]